MYRMKPGVVGTLSRGAVALALGLSLFLGSSGAGPSASAEGPASVSEVIFVGLVLTETSGTLPDYVRAVGPRGAACGTAVVTGLSDYVGSYVLRVASSQQKRGCVESGEFIQFLLLNGRVDDGIWADQVWISMRDTTTVQSLNLRSAVNLTDRWLGRVGIDGAASWVRWAGGSVPLDVALAELPLPISAVYYLDPASGKFVGVMSSTPDVVLTAGDLFFVQFR